MSKDKLNPEDDIIAEPYKGPDAVSAGAGEGYILHFVSAAVGLGIGMAGTLIFHKTVLNWVKTWREGSHALVHSDHVIKRGWGKFIHGLVGKGEGSMDEMRRSAELIKDDMVREKAIRFVNEQEHGFGEWFLNHTIGFIPGARKFFNKQAESRGKEFVERLDLAVTAGGTLGGFGFFGIPLLVFPHGAKKGLDGKRQFDRLKAEIVDLRERYDSLHDQYIDTKIALEDIKTHRSAADGDLIVAADQTPDMKPTRDVETTAQLDSGNGTIEEPRIKSPVIAPQPHVHADSGNGTIEEPRIKNPKIGPQPHITALNDSGNGTIEEPRIKSPVIAPQPHLHAHQHTKQANDNALNDNEATPKEHRHTVNASHTHAAYREPPKPALSKAEGDWKEKVTTQKDAGAEQGIHA